MIEGLGRTGRLVTSAALILFLAFASLASAPDTDIKVLATGLGAGILLDATIVRALLLPSLVSLLGRWNWWLPEPLAQLLRVPAQALEPARLESRYPSAYALNRRGRVTAGARRRPHPLLHAHAAFDRGAREAVEQPPVSCALSQCSRHVRGNDPG